MKNGVFKDGPMKRKESLCFLANSKVTNPVAPHVGVPTDLTNLGNVDKDLAKRG